MKWYFLIPTSLMLACGSGGGSSSNNVIPQPTPVGAVHGTQHIHFYASRNGNSVNNGSMTVTVQTSLTVPLPQDIVVTQNTAEAFTVTFIASGTDCQFQHNAGSTTMNLDSCNVKSVNLVNGDAVLLSVNPGPNNNTNIESDIVFQF